MALKSEIFSNLASGLQNLAVIISLFISAMWAYRIFVYQNPAFYETGTEFIGVDKRNISGDIKLVLLDKKISAYVVILELKNHSKTHSQIFPYPFININYTHLRDKNGKPDYTDKSGQSATFNSHLIVGNGLLIPAMGSSIYKAFIDFEKEGIYLVESNPCMAMKTDCLIQTYVLVNKG